MADSILPQQELDRLYRRWQAEPTPQLSLRLAEEYRRAGEAERGLAIIEEYLADHPEHTSSKVALGRFLLDLDRPARATELLEEVATLDPTHLVANKHLIRAYAATGERRKAVDRFDLYALLNEGDPELDSLRRLVEEGEGADAGPPPPPVEGPAAPSMVPEAARPAPADAPAEVAPPPPPPTDPFPLAAANGSSGGANADEPASGRSPSDEPFSNLWQGMEDRWYRNALASEGIFGAAGGAARTTEAAPADRPASQAAPLETPIESRLSGADQGAEGPFELVSAEPPSIPAAEATPPAAPAMPPVTPPLDPAAGESAPGRPWPSAAERSERPVATFLGEAAPPVRREAASSGWTLTAARLLERIELPPEADRSARRRAVLSAYLDRLRAGAASDV